MAEDVTGIIDIPPPLPTEGIEDISFQFSQLTEKFSRMIDTIMTLDTEGEILLSYLKNLASVGDIIVDQSPFLVVIKEGNTFISVNKNYVAATGYTRREIETQDPVLYFSSQAAQVKARLESLNNVPHYNDSFRMRRKDGQ